MENKTRTLKINPEPTKTLSRPQSAKVEKEEEEEYVIAKPVPDTGVGGSSLDTMTANLATEMMNAAISFHRLHLKVKGEGSFSAHKALGEFYEGLHDHADTLVEGYQGVAEKLLSYKDSPIRALDTVADGVAYLRDLYNTVNKLQGMMPYSEIVNNLDLVKDSINSTKYKLIFLS
jgi:DNA-binding ferritin-like protein